MDKRTATLTLTEKLQQMGYVNLVADTAVKSYLLENAKSAVLDIGDNSPRVMDFKEIDFSKDSKYDKLSLSSLKQKCPQANYLFAEGNKIRLKGESRNTLITPAAIIGEAEARILKKEYYKDVPYLMQRALEVLEIPNFIADYELYSSLCNDNIDTQELGLKAKFSNKNSRFYVPYKGSKSIEIGDIVQCKKTDKFYLVENIESKRILGTRFNDDELKIPCKEGRYGFCLNENIKRIYKSYSTLSTKFKDFAFALPAEDQDIYLNQMILETITNIDTITDILYNAYRDEKNFGEYFDVVNKDAQDQAFNVLKSIQERNSSYDSFLWDKGFKEVNLDYMRLYKKDYQEFIEYFRNKKQDEKKTILKSIMNCDYTNEDVASWLHENEIELLREVSMDG